MAISIIQVFCKIILEFLFASANMQSILSDSNLKKAFELFDKVYHNIKIGWKWIYISR